MTHEKFLKLLQDRDAALECLRQLEDDVDPNTEYVFLQGHQEWLCMQELLELAKFAAGITPGYVPGVTHGESPSGRIDIGRPNIQNVVVQTGAGKAMQAAIFPTDLQLKAKDGACCDNEKRSLAGGCENCGDPCL